MLLAQTPKEIQQYAQWIAWRGEQRADGKITKIPFNVKNGEKANVTDPYDFATFDYVCEQILKKRYDGAGFCFTDFDPYLGIDLDASATDAETLARHTLIYQRFNSYSELSPSRTGCHIIVKGKIPHGVSRRRQNIEMYSQGRFFTMTGDVVNPVAIADRQSMVTALFNELLGDKRVIAYNPQDIDEPMTASDEDVIARMLNAANGDKVQLLLEGKWQDLNYPSQSEADLALIDVIAFFTQNREQIRRIFRQSPLGWRDKAWKREGRAGASDYLSWMINKSFDKTPLPIDMDGLRNMLEAQIAETARSNYGGQPPVAIPLDTAYAVPSDPFPPVLNPYECPTGLIGDIAQYIYAQSSRPVPEIALTGALGLMAGICGRAWSVKGSGLALYLLLLAPTGTGKEAMNSGISKLIDAVAGAATPENPTLVSADLVLGPAAFESAQSLIKYMDGKSACFVSVLGEFGLTMQRMSGPFASPNDKNIRKIILDAYGKNQVGNKYRSHVWADKEKNTGAIICPAMTLIGESAPDEFFDKMDESVISGGFLPRFITVDYMKGIRPELNKNAHLVKPSADLVARLGQLIMASFEFQAQGRNIVCEFSKEAEKLDDEFEKYTTLQINMAGVEVIKRELWTRAHLKARKVAALMSIGESQDFKKPIPIEVDILKYAINFVITDVYTMKKRFVGDANNYISGLKDIEALQLEEVKRVFREFVQKEFMPSYGGTLQMHNDRVIPINYIQVRTSRVKAFKEDRLGAANAMRRTLAMLIDCGAIREVGGTDKKQYNTTAKLYMIADPQQMGI